MEVILLLVVYMNCITSVFNDRILTYVKADVKRSLCPSTNQYRLITRSILKCALKCSNTDLCTKYMYCKRYRTCDLLTELEECMSVYDDSCQCRAKRSRQDGNGSLVCHNGYYGDNCEYIVEDCHQAQSMNTSPIKTVSLFIQPNASAPPFQIFCTYNSKEYSLIMIRLRTACQTQFNNTWENYKEGFGNSREGLWLGLNKMNALTSVPNRRFVLIIKLYGNKYSCVTQITDFKVGDESSRYTLSLGNTPQLSVSQCNDALQGGLLSANNRPFSTFDNPSNNSYCPLAKSAGWWFADHPNCTAANLNGPMDAPYPFYFADPNFENISIVAVEMGIVSI